jgi:hypothetical protein
MKGLRGHIITEFRRRFLWWGYSFSAPGQSGAIRGHLQEATGLN